MTPAEKQIVWQLKNANKTGKTQNNLTPMKCTSTRTSHMSAMSLLSATGNSDEEDLFPNDSSGGNHSNKALARQTTKCQAMGD